MTRQTSTPPTDRPNYTPPVNEGDATGGVIPYKNPAALIAYYLGVFSLIPFFVIGIAALVLGIIGLRNRKRNPAIRGAIHAWIGIIVGGLFGVLWLVLTVGTIAAAVLRK